MLGEEQWLLIWVRFDGIFTGAKWYLFFGFWVKTTNS